jgi:hypothetical protein
MSPDPMPMFELDGDRIELLDDFYDEFSRVRGLCHPAAKSPPIQDCAWISRDGTTVDASVPSHEPRTGRR